MQFFYEYLVKIDSQEYRFGCFNDNPSKEKIVKVTPKGHLNGLDAESLVKHRTFKIDSREFIIREVYFK